jgi:hypothetical protein
VAVLLGCAEAAPMPAGRPTMAACEQQRDGETAAGCRCAWNDDWGWAWATVDGGFRGAADWCPGAQP